MKTIVLIFSILLLAACGTSTHPDTAKTARAGDPTAVSACSEPFRLDYRDVRQSLETVKKDMNEAYSEQAKASKSPAELHDAEATAYRDALACRAKAVALRSKYDGYRCKSAIPGVTRLIEVTPLMTKLIDALDRVPAALQVI